VELSGTGPRGISRGHRQSHTGQVRHLFNQNTTQKTTSAMNLHNLSKYSSDVVSVQMIKLDPYVTPTNETTKIISEISEANDLCAPGGYAFTRRKVQTEVRTLGTSCYDPVYKTSAATDGLSDTFESSSSLQTPRSTEWTDFRTSSPPSSTYSWEGRTLSCGCPASYWDSTIDDSRCSECVYSDIIPGDGNVTSQIDNNNCDISTTEVIVDTNESSEYVSSTVTPPTVGLFGRGDVQELKTSSGKDVADLRSLDSYPDSTIITQGCIDDAATETNLESPGIDLVSVPELVADCFKIA